MNHSSKVSPSFSSAHRLAQLVIVFSAILSAVNLVAIAVRYRQVLIDDSDWQIIGVLQAFAILATGIFFLIWFYCAHQNLRALGIRRGRYSSPWSILLFFVPFLNLYYGYDLVKELWRQSSPDLGFSDDFLKQHASTLKQYPTKTSRIGLWWGFTIASSFMARTSLLLLSSPTVSNSEFVSATWMNMIADALSIAASISLILVVKDTDERQEEKHRRLTINVASQQMTELLPT
ncbi:MAG TPA: DUF4328 domain-containing protein [Pyrinomonadaceae bacterium]|nr:DUF4328 domain-containing protein [Pyrinomonadaceae bacterium]